MSGDFHPEQKRYLEGFVAGLQKDGTVTNSERRISRQRMFTPLPGERMPIRIPASPRRKLPRAPSRLFYSLSAAGANTPFYRAAGEDLVGADGGCRGGGVSFSNERWTDVLA